MGNASYRQTTGNQYLTQDLRNYFQNDLPKFILQSKIGNGKFMKTYIMRVDSTPIVVKVYMKLNDEDLQIPSKNLAFIWRILTPIKYPNLLPYQLWLKSSSRIKSNASPVYLIRQFFNTNLYDRLSTRPFLNEIEKLFIVYQLLKCLEICHEHDIVHGDIKPENLMCTTSNWLILTDFSPFKPTMIPDDDPTDFQYYFDSMSRHRCYVAPERFYRKEVKSRWGGKEGFSQSNDNDSDDSDFLTETNGKISNSTSARNHMVTQAAITTAMDVFSVGCVIAEIFLDGVPLLDLPGMLQYVSGTNGSGISSANLENEHPAQLSFSPNGSGRSFNCLDDDESPAKTLLSRIDNKLVKKVVIDMTQRDPTKRLSVSDYIDILSGKLSFQNIVEEFGNCKSFLESSESTSNISGNCPFPSHFDSYLYPLYLKMHWNGITPDDRISIVCESYGELIRTITGSVEDSRSFGPEIDFFTSGAMRSTYLFIDNKSHTMPIFSKSNISETFEDIFCISKGPGGALYEDPNKQMQMQGVLGNNSLNGIALFDFRHRSIKMARLRGTQRHQNLITKPLFATYKRRELIQNMNINFELFDQDHGKVDDLFKKSEIQGVLEKDFGYGFLTCGQSDDNFFDLKSETHLIGSCGIKSVRPTFDSVVLIVDILNSNYRHLKYPQSKLVCLMLLTRLGLLTSDDIILQRIIPTLLVAIEDQSAPVRAMTLRSLRSVLVVVQNFSLLESNIFPSYIFPALSRVAKDNEIIVRVAFAESIGRFAETSKTFLDQAHFQALQKSVFETKLASVDNDPVDCISVEFPYNQKLEQLKEQISRWIRDLVVDAVVVSNQAGNVLDNSFQKNNHNNRVASASGSLVKRVILMDIMRLCVFFGQENTMDKLLTQLLTFLNSQDWELRYAFCARIPSVCAFLGPTITSECILPCIENAIYDVEEKVVVCALHCLTTLTLLGLLSKFIIVDFTKKCKGLLLHPSDTVRDAVVDFLCGATNTLGHIDSLVFLLPQISEMLTYDLRSVSAITAEVLRCALVSPVPRKVFRKGVFDRLSVMSSFNPASGSLMDSPLCIVPNDDHEGDFDLCSSKNSLPVKLLIMSSYLDLAAAEINTKTLQWRNGMISSNIASNVVDGLKSHLLTSEEVMYKSRLGSLLDLNAIQMPDHSLQNLLIPHQKYGVFYFPSLPEDLRRNVLYIDNDGFKNSNKLRMLFGITVSQADAIRALAAGAGDHWENQVSQINMNGNGSATHLPIGSSRTSQISSLNPSVGQSRVKSVVNRGDGSQQTSTVSGVSASQLYLNNTIVKLRTTTHPAYSESVVLLKRIKALNIPPLPPDVGTLLQPDERKYSAYLDSLDTSSSMDSQSRSGWRPKENVLLTSLKEHSDAVNRLVVSPDQSFFASASSDKTVKIWQTKNIDRMAFPRSVVTYNKHKGAVLDMTVIENSHSLASASNDGFIHVWRVDMGSGTGPFGVSNYDSEDLLANANGAVNTGLHHRPSVFVSGTSVVRSIDAAEGAITSVHHYNGDVASVVTYATQNGGIHGWDLRAANEAFSLPLRPELGYTTCMTIAPDRNWIAVGSSKGYISLFDVRFNTCSKLYHHSNGSAIHRLACCKSLSGGNNSGGVYGINSGHNSAMPNTEGAYLFVASGVNEAAVWGIPEAGECLKCFRTVSLDASRSPVAPMPILRDIQLPRHPNSVIMEASRSFVTRTSTTEHSVRAIIGRISHSSVSYLVTAGTDRSIRFWDFISPSKCYTVSGLEAAQPKAIFDMPKISHVQQNSTGANATGKLFMCYVAAVPSADKILQAHLPVREGRGVCSPNTNAKDSILDLKNVDLPIRLLLSSSSDGEIKLWR